MTGNPAEAGTDTGDSLPATPKGYAMRTGLLEATAGALADVGYGGINVIEIVSRAGTSRTNFYKHFRDVEHAVLELGRGPMGRFVALVCRHPPRRAAVDHRAVQAWLREIIELRERHHVILHSLQLAAEAHPESALRTEWERWQSELRRGVRSWIDEARGISGGDDPLPVGDLAEVVAEAGDALRRRWVRRHPDGLSSQGLDTVADLAARISLRLIAPGRDRQATGSGVDPLDAP